MPVEYSPSITSARIIPSLLRCPPERGKIRSSRRRPDGSVSRAWNWGGTGMTFERENLKRLGGYVPGEQPRRAKAKLNTSENPFPPCDAVLRVLAGIDGEMLRQYPDLT